MVRASIYVNDENSCFVVSPPILDCLQNNFPWFTPSGWVTAGVGDAPALSGDDLLPSPGPGGLHQPPLPLSAAGEALLSFSLCNAEVDPESGAGFASWDFDRFLRRYLSPVVQILSPVMHLDVESQVSTCVYPDISMSNIDESFIDPELLDVQ